MRSYRTINRVCGWVSFILAAIVYTLTVEPSASFWDCPEFILSAAKLEVGHPPGAPFFMLTGNVISQLAGDPAQIALLINIMNALLSAGCILFLFWTITHLTRQLIAGNGDGENLRPEQIFLVMGCGFAGALIYTFSDTFWFSAVEGEVYAFSSFFTAVAFWLMLRWEEEADSPRSDRWLILLAYLIGLSIGVHLLNLLCIPAAGLLFYYRKWKQPTLKGTLLALFLSCLLVAFVLYGIVPGVMKVAGQFELALVNGLHAAYNSGMLLYVLLLMGVLIWSCAESIRSSHPMRMSLAFLLSLLLLGITMQGSTLFTVLLSAILAFGCLFLLRRYLRQHPEGAAWRILHVLSFSLLMMTVGYSSYAVILIRSAANTPMDQQSPEDPFTLKDYLGREQYGDTPLLYGPTFASPRALKEKDGYLSYDYQETEPQYRRKDWTADSTRHEYVVTGHKLKPLYQPETCVWFPRMYNDQYADAYKSWLGTMQGKTVTYYDKASGEMTSIEIPSAWNNLRYFLTYQVNFMYIRYFLWNFVGRQDDVQGNGLPDHGNWITGFSFIDRHLTGDPEALPDSQKHNKGHNVYYGLPLLLGLLGICWQLRKGQKGNQQFNIVLLLFLMTGLAIILYLNQAPTQPRERDYAYAGSFYAFTIWTGMGVAGIAALLKRKLKPAAAVLLAGIVGILIPLQMASQTWDDHDRSGRMVCHDMGQNYLYTLQEKGNPVLFVNGDNETFPLWYSTEVENIRTDTRVCNLMYLSGGWYADQMKRPAYSSPGLPFSIPRAYYRDGVNDAVSVNPVVGQDENGTAIRLKEQIETFYREHPDEKPFGEDPWEWKNIVRHWLTSDKADLRCIPTDEIHIPVDKEAVRRSGMLIPEGTEIPDTMIIRLKGRGYLTRSSLMLIDLISSCNWERPLYVASTMRIEEYLDISRNLVQEGLAQRIVPYDAVAAGATIDTDKTYRNLMEKFRYGGLDDPDLYLDETNIRMVLSLRRIMTETAERLYQQGDTLRARRLLDRCCQEIRNPAVQTDKYGYSDRIGILYQLLGETSLGIRHWRDWYTDRTQYADWYLTLSPERLLACDEELVRILYAQSDGLQNALRCGMPVEEKTITRYLHTAQTARLRLQQCGSRYTRLIDELTAPFNGTEEDTIH